MNDNASDGKIQVVTEIHMPWTLTEISALVYEADLTINWVKASSHQKVNLVSNPAPYVVSFENRIDFPWPLDDRWGNNKALAFVGEGLDNVCQTTYSHPKHEHSFLGYKVAHKPKGVTELINKGGVRYYRI